MDGIPLPGGRTKRTFIGAAAGILLAAALLFPFPARAGVKVEGVPSWLRERMERSAETVWSEIVSGGNEAAGQKALSLLSLVSERVFTGYAVVETVGDGGDVILRLRPGEKIPWVVEIAPPQLSPPVGFWFREDAAGLEKKIGELLLLLPLDALAWADLPLRDAIASVAAAQVPGWTPGLLVRLQDGRRILQVSFVPKPPLVLTVVPKVYSSSLPVMLRSDLRENMLLTLAPVVGLPIEWAAANRKRIEALAEEKLLDSNTVGNARAGVEVNFQPAEIAPANATVESPRYTIRAWVAAYAGSDTKYPEVGLHLGRKFLPFSGLTMELYGEWILSANDFSLESRWGVRWSPWKHIMAGVEQAYPGSVTWYRFWFEGGVNAPYAWWRISEEGDHSAGIGYRVNGRISLELHYDGRDEEKISLKAISDLQAFRHGGSKVKEKTVTLEKIASAAGGKAIGPAESVVEGISSPEDIRPGRICALWTKGEMPRVPEGAFILASPAFFDSFPGSRGVAVEDPRSSFPTLLSLFESKEKKKGIHPSAVVDPDAEISPHAWIGPLSVVEEGAVVEEGVQLRGRVFIGRKCRVGAHSVIEPGAVLLESVRTGRNCLIHGGAVLGCDGFGILPGEDGMPPRKIPQLGGVLLGDGVEIGACSTVDRGTLDDTVVGSFTKVDDHVHIAHNVRIGRGCILVAMTGIAGSAVLEDNVTMAARSGAADHVRIGRGATVAACGGATKDVPPGRVVSGFPARDHGSNFRIQAALRRLPELLNRVKRLEGKRDGLSEKEGSPGIAPAEQGDGR